MVSSSEFVSSASDASSPIEVEEIVLYVNGRRCAVSPRDWDPSTTLLTFLRSPPLHLTGTKLGCGEGGCGACTVCVQSWSPSSSSVVHRSVNACICPLFACDGMHVITVEGIGSRKSMHPVQERMARGYGSQCGFCTPGIVMSMYTILRNNPHPTPEEFEHGLDGNLCRCTGYRPILDVAKSFSCPCGMDSGSCPCSNSSGSECEASKSLESSLMCNWSQFEEYRPERDLIFPPALKHYQSGLLRLQGDRTLWIRPLSLEQLLLAKEEFPHAKIIVGNSEVGIETKFKNMEYNVLICATHVPELNLMNLIDDTRVVIGSSTTLSVIQSTFLKWCQSLPFFSTRGLRAVLEQLRWFAGTQIRNVAAVGGNIVTASPISDLNPVWMAMNTLLHLQSREFGERVVPMREFFLGYRRVDMKPNEVLVSIEFSLSREFEFIFAYKQARRREDDIAIVNAGMRMVINPGSSASSTASSVEPVISECSLSFGGMAPISISALKTESFLMGKPFCVNTLEDTLSVLADEMSLDPKAPPGMIEYRRTLCLSFFYRFFHSVAVEFQSACAHCFSWSDPEALSVVHRFKRPISSGKQTFPEPLFDIVGQPTPHKSAELQTTGEATYTDDTPPQYGELIAALVLSTVPHARIVSVDTTEALAVPGVVGYFDSKDVPGDNNIGPIVHDEEVFVTKETTSVGQPLGVIVAENEYAAKLAARLVHVEYENLPAIFSIDEAIEMESFIGPVKKLEKGHVDEAWSQCDHVVEGEMRVGGQEHFYLEPHISIVWMGENDEVQIVSSTQAASKTQTLVASTLGLPSHKVVCRVKRIGGGFGGKETRNVFISCACAVPAYHLKRPVRLLLDRDIDMATSGQRHAFLGRYKVGFRSDGRIEAFDVHVYNNAGFSMDLSPPVLERALFHIENAYDIPNVRVVGRVCKTNTSSNTAFRGFGGPQGMMICEDMIDRVSRYLQIDPSAVRGMNLYHDGSMTPFHQVISNCRLQDMWDQLYASSDYASRRAAIEEFNRSHVWQKRGISMIPTKFGISFTAKFMNQGGSLVNVYADGSVLISHGGIEMGQGLHTKVCQIAAQTFGIPISRVHIAETSTDKVPNQIASAASMSSDIYGMATFYACEEIKTRLDAVREEFFASDPDASWETVVGRAYIERVNLSAQGFYKVPNLDFDWSVGRGSPFSYFTYGIACSEVELDCLTGDFHIVRTDILMDLGKSLNPSVDVGQIEGAFVQGMGLFTIEELVWGDSDHPWMRPGWLYTRGPGTYKIPSFNDVPIDFRVSLLQDAVNPLAIHSSKAVGEPPLFLGSTVFYALKEAISSRRKDAGISGPFSLPSPSTSERLRMACPDKLVQIVVEADDDGTVPTKGSW